ncbi:MAG TPA: VOC family protein [Frankiaceae bacterium]|nr:VOC family protein [Frankiaceae bacterium]
MTVPARTSLVTLGVGDVDRAAAFYERLGWTRSAASVPGVVAFFPTNGAVIAVWSAAELATDMNVGGGEPGAFRGVAIAINVESEAEVDRVLAAAETAGATIRKPGTRAEWGGYSGYFADPDGNAWEVAYNPGWPLENGVPQLP